MEVEVRLVRRRACARALHVISYVVFKCLVCIEIVTVRLVANTPLSFRHPSQQEVRVGVRSDMSGLLGRIVDLDAGEGGVEEGNA